MTDNTLTQADLDALKQYDTPTICNALEHLQPARRTQGFTRRELRCLNPELSPIVGYARTATIRALAPPNLSPTEISERRLAYYDYIANGGPLPSVVVIQDLDTDPGFGAFWGEVNTTIHKSLGALGALTNGSFRDLNDCAEGFQLLGGSVGTSHAWVQPVDWGVTVEVFGLSVDSGELIHADRHGAVSIPLALVKQLPAAVALLTKREKVILDACKAPDFDIDALKAAIRGAADIH